MRARAPWHQVPKARITFRPRVSRSSDSACLTQAAREHVSGGGGAWKRRLKRRCGQTADYAHHQVARGGRLLAVMVTIWDVPGRRRGEGKWLATTWRSTSLIEGHDAGQPTNYRELPGDQHGDGQSASLVFYSLD